MDKRRNWFNGLRIFLLTTLSMPSAAVCGTLSTLHTFTAADDDGARPETAPTLARSGSLFGETLLGGDATCTTLMYTPSLGCGVTYRLDPDGTFHAIVIFNGDISGANGFTSTTLRGDTLYGSTLRGGHDDLGTVFSAHFNGSNYTLIHSYSGNGDGADPEGNMVADPAGNVFGISLDENGPSSLFEITPDGSYSDVHHFTTDPGEYTPTSMIIDASGTILGTTREGAAGCNYKGFKPPTECGAIYSYEPSTGIFAVLHNFKGHYDGAYPLVGGVSANGTVFGATTAGGKYGLGTLFELRRDAAGYTYHKLHDFTGGADGGTPNQPYSDIHGTITGTTQIDGLAAGKPAFGTLFSLPRNGTFTTLYTFTAAGGRMPMGSVTPGASGVFYGVTFTNGTTSCTRPDGSVVQFNGGCGTIWKYTP